MSPDHPKLRTDLIVRRQRTPAGTVFVLKDPVSQRFFRLREAEFSLAEQLDGRTPLEVARRNTEQRFDATISDDTIERFVRRLTDIGLLEVQRPEHGLHEPRRVRGSLLYLRLKAFDPDRLLDRMVGRLGFFFTPQFLVVSGGLVVLAFGITMGRWDEIYRDLLRLSRLQRLLLAWLTDLLPGRRVVESIGRRRLLRRDRQRAVDRTMPRHARRTAGARRACSASEHCGPRSGLS
jgi:hypothetical protein